MEITYIQRNFHMAALRFDYGNIVSSSRLGMSMMTLASGVIPVTMHLPSSSPFIPITPRTNE